MFLLGDGLIAPIKVPIPAGPPPFFGEPNLLKQSPIIGIFGDQTKEEDALMKSLSDLLWNYDPRLQEPLSRLRNATSLTLMVIAAWALVRILAIFLLEEVLAARARQKQTWPVCPVCGQKLQSKGFRNRELSTLFGGVPPVSLHEIV